MNHAAHHTETKYMIPGFFSGLFLGGCVSMGVYKFYLSEHKSGKKEKNIPIPTRYNTQSLSWIVYNVSHEAGGELLDLHQEISGKAATQNRNKNDYALTVEKYMYDTTK